MGKHAWPYSEESDRDPGLYTPPRHRRLRPVVHAMSTEPWEVALRYHMEGPGLTTTVDRSDLRRVLAEVDRLREEVDQLSIQVDRLRDSIIEPPVKYRVEDNIRGTVASREYDNEEAASAACCALNDEAGPGGKYGVYCNDGSGWSRVMS